MEQTSKKTQRMSIYFPAGLLEKVRQSAEAHHRSFNQEVLFILDQAVSNADPSFSFDKEEQTFLIHFSTRTLMLLHTLAIKDEETIHEVIERLVRSEIKRAAEGVQQRWLDQGLPLSEEEKE